VQSNSDANRLRFRLTGPSVTSIRPLQPTNAPVRQKMPEHKAVLHLMKPVDPHTALQARSQQCPGFAGFTNSIVNQPGEQCSLSAQGMCRFFHMAVAERPLHTPQTGTAADFPRLLCSVSVWTANLAG